MADAFIGLDLGTTGIKAAAFDEHDRQLALTTVPTPTNHVPAGGAEYRAEELWAAACSVLQGVTQQLAVSGHVAAAIAVASMGESGVLVDGAGQSVAPVIAWFDARTEPQAAWWREHVGAERTQAIAAVQPRPVFAAAKMLWTKAHLPDAWAAGQHWLNMADWATHRLSGVMATDYSLASRTMLFDLAARTWSDELIDAAGLDPTMLAPLIESGQRVGTVTPEAAASTGLPAGIPVSAGGQDHVCAALALDVTEPGMLLDSIGTAEAFFLVTDGVDDTDRLAAAGIAQGAHVEPGRTYAMTGLAPGGGRIDQAREDSGLDWDAFLATPEADAVIESVAVDGQARIAELLDAAGAADVRHIATGGGSRNHRLIERKQAIGGRPITVAPETEATALGAAILARRALEAV
ncbi:FGGY-family carbohydrate kinase [Candidatus Poriferisodalis sp.]|uniref:FGGY-family carbohydrate kinase n=1 Tax=Candidatus Poriferisodalis sp. TaxID=3101277 RepID=UPI003B012431